MRVLIQADKLIMSSSSFLTLSAWLPLPPGLCLQLTLFVVSPVRKWLNRFLPKLCEKLGRGPWKMRVMCFFFLSFFFFFPNALLALAGAPTCWLQDLPNVRQAECEVPLQVGARSINRVLIKAGAPLSESEAPRQKASGCSGSKLTLFHLQWNKT